ncbi:hypothetical protein [Streptomyces sp. R33]|uniref:Uncharacterized protein n=1 Tax=Streptomyces sp. R33 TaxID=3238629 RepID=A0AB39Y906_9ACTN
MNDDGQNEPNEQNEPNRQQAQPFPADPRSDPRSDTRPQQPAAAPRLPPPRRGADWMFGGVYGTVLASALLAALDQEGDAFTPFYDASWVLVTACAAALAHGYSHHMAGHQAGSAAHRRRVLSRALWNERPMIVATLPTVLLLVVSGLADWGSYEVTAVGLGLNTALLFAWGSFVALRVGYRTGPALLMGLADATIGLAIIVANAVIK